MSIVLSDGINILEKEVIEVSKTKSTNTIFLVAKISIDDNGKICGLRWGTPVPKEGLGLLVDYMIKSDENIVMTTC